MEVPRFQPKHCVAVDEQNTLGTVARMESPGARMSTQSSSSLLNVENPARSSHDVVAPTEITSG